MSEPTKAELRAAVKAQAEELDVLLQDAIWVTEDDSALAAADYILLGQFHELRGVLARVAASTDRLAALEGRHADA